jgi:hypothetical protein
MEAEGKNKVHMMLYSFQRDKSLGPNILPVEFFLGCYILLRKISTKVVDLRNSIGKPLVTSIQHV